MTNTELIALKAELTNDPASLGLTTLSADDEANANKLNEVRETIHIDRGIVNINEIDFDRDEYNAMTPADRDWLALQTIGGSVQPSKIRDDLNKVFGANTTTRASYEAAFTRTASRIEQLQSLGTLSVSSVSPSDVADARNAT